MGLIVCNKPTAVKTIGVLERLTNHGNPMKVTGILQAIVNAWKVLGGGISHYLRVTFPIDPQVCINASCDKPNRIVVHFSDLAAILKSDAKAPIKSLLVFNTNPVNPASDQTR